MPTRTKDDEGAIDAHNRRLVERMQLGGRAFVSSTTLAERCYLRACMVNPRAELEDVLAVLDAARTAAGDAGGCSYPQKSERRRPSPGTAPLWRAH
jgi:hypothetical protein